MGRYIFRYFRTIVLLWLANWAFGWCADNFELPCYIMLFANPILMIRSGLQNWRERRTASETSHRIMCILIAYMCWSAALWWILNFTML